MYRNTGKPNKYAPVDNKYARPACGSEEQGCFTRIRSVSVHSRLGSLHSSGVRVWHHGEQSQNRFSHDEGCEGVVVVKDSTLSIDATVSGLPTNTLQTLFVLSMVMLLSQGSS